MVRAAPGTDGSTTDALRTHLASLARDRKSATVTLERGPFPARIVVRAGEVVEVRVDGVRGERGLSRALDAEQGRWRVDADAAGSRAPHAAPISLDDVFARRERVRELARVVGGLDAIWGVRFRVLQRELQSIPDDVNPLLRLVDGKRTIGRVLVESPFEEQLTIRVLHRLLTKGILVRPDEPESVIDDASSSPLADVLARGLVSQGRPRSEPPTPTPAPTTPKRAREKEPRPLPPARVVDDDKRAAADDEESEVAVRAWSSKRVRPPSLVPMNGARFDAESEDDGPDGDDAAALVVEDEAPPVALEPDAQPDEDIARDATPGRDAAEVDDEGEQARVAEEVSEGSDVIVDARTEEITEPQRGHRAEHADARDEERAPGVDDAIARSPDEPGDEEAPAEVEPSAELSSWLDEEHAFFARDARADEASAITPADDAAAIWRAVVVAIGLFALVVLLTFALASGDERPDDDAPADRADVVEAP